MAIRVVRLGSERLCDEGLRIGTVRRPPRGVPKGEYASQDYFDVWLPNVAPSAELVKLARSAASDQDWAHFCKKYRHELAVPERSKVIELLAALSHATNFSIGCYCEQEARCHRSVLKEILAEHGARFK